MKVGEKAVLTCPSAIAYGDSGRPPTIPGGATLIFDVELVSIAPPNQAPPRCRGCRRPVAVPPAVPRSRGRRMQLHMGGPGGPQKLTLPPPSSQKPAAPPK